LVDRAEYQSKGGSDFVRNIGKQLEFIRMQPLQTAFAKIVGYQRKKSYKYGEINNIRKGATVPGRSDMQRNPSAFGIVTKFTRTDFRLVRDGRENVVCYEVCVCQRRIPHIIAGLDSVVLMNVFGTVEVHDR